jgi:hydrogenase maturation protein HypF
MTASRPLTARFVRVSGVVQGVGFRPFVHRIALRHELAGWVRNVAGTVEIHVEGDDDSLDAFEGELRSGAPPVARITTVLAEASVAEGSRGFRILESSDAGGSRPVPPDVAICATCESELFDPLDRRFRHPFITCTDCGPRFTVIKSLPYDRERTSMAPFELCARCRAEYETPADRRHHAETVACLDCGPRVWFELDDGFRLCDGDEAIRGAAALLGVGWIVAIRGVGGFHLACDATDESAVRELRSRKKRDAKPFAVMVRTLEEARAVAAITAEEEKLLAGPERPVVLIERRVTSRLAPSVSPGLNRVGLMLAYSPLHHLLLEAVQRPLVMTSGNLSDEPITIGNGDALQRLRDIADGFLLHDREIISRVDDSVARVVDGTPLLMRRARGYAPLAIPLPVSSPRQLVALGPHLKNTFTLVRDSSAFVSPHIGDLDGLESLSYFNSVLARYEDLFRIVPEVAVRDLHPGYLTTRVADSLGLERVIAVQHHHAHIAAVAAEHGVTQQVVGLAFDGTGYGDDGNVWGAETMVADLCGFHRMAQLSYVPLAGGDLAAREPWRAALGFLSLDRGAASAFSLAFKGVGDAERSIADLQIARHLNAPLASSMGRLFDAAAAVLGVRQRASYEGQAAAELESLAGALRAHPFPFPVTEREGRLVLDPLPLLVALGEARRSGDDVDLLAARFHESIVHACADVARSVAGATGIQVVALGGGSFQNARLLSGIRRRLEEAGLRVLVPRLLPPNDGAISYGQAAVAAALLDREG